MGQAKYSLIARLQVNDALARHQAIAREVQLTMTLVKNNSPQKTTLRSEHDLSPDLTPFDFDQIKRAREARGQFKLIRYDKYKKGGIQIAK